MVASSKASFSSISPAATVRRISSAALSYDFSFSVRSTVSQLRAIVAAAVAPTTAFIQRQVRLVFDLDEDMCHVTVACPSCRTCHRPPAVLCRCRRIFKNPFYMAFSLLSLSSHTSSFASVCVRCVFLTQAVLPSEIDGASVPDPSLSSVILRQDQCRFSCLFPSHCVPFLSPPLCLHSLYPSSSPTSALGLAMVSSCSFLGHRFANVCTPSPKWLTCISPSILGVKPNLKLRETDILLV